jgi:hypothetical protein
MICYIELNNNYIGRSYDKLNGDYSSKDDINPFAGQSAYAALLNIST